MAATLSAFSTSAVVPLPPPLALHATGRASATTALCLLDVPGFTASWQGAAAPCQSIGCRLAAHRADTPLPTARSCGPASRFALFPGHSTAFASSMARVCQSVHAALLRPVQRAAEVYGQCFAVWQSERCGAGCRPRLAAHRGWAPDLRW